MLPPAAVARRRPPAGEPLYALDSGSLPRLALDLDGWDGPVVNIDHHHDNTRFGDLGAGAAAGEQHQRDRLRPRPRPGSRARPRGRDRAVRRHLVRLGPLPPRSTSPRPSSPPWLVELGVDLDRACTASCTSDARWAPFVSRAARSPAPGRCRRPRPRGRAHARRLRRLRRGRARDRGYRRPPARRRRRRGRRPSSRSRTGSPRVRVSLRSSAARRERRGRPQGGGGHVRAAGFSSDESPEEVTAWLSSELARLLSTASS